MEQQNQLIGFIGAGNMGSTMIGAILKAKLAKSQQIRVYDPADDHLTKLQREYNIGIAQSNVTLFDSCRTIILAIKPQAMTTVLGEIKNGWKADLRDRKLIISIAAGTRLETLEKFLYARLDASAQQNMPIIRVMPNTPALVLEAMTGMAANRHAETADINTTRDLFSSMGRVRYFEEAAMDAVTAISGSGPAYVFYFIEAMTEAAQNLGLSQTDAAVMVQQTFTGALKLLSQSDKSPAELRRQVTSPGGTTAAALKVFEKHQLRQHFIEALAAAEKRGAELSHPENNGQ